MTDYLNDYCMHDHTCGQLRASDVDSQVTLTGWVWHNRDHGGLIFVDLRDREGYTQVVIDPDCVSAEDFAVAEHLGREYVVEIVGKVRARAEGTVNPNMATGEIEVLATSVKVLNTSVTPPFSIEDGIETDETTRMKWRYMDLRRPEMFNAIKLRHTVAQAMRSALNDRGFIEVETPILANSTPEGARDYIVPSRPNPGKFYALPQSPQQFKQMLMCGGIERYYQIARCFRDEDLRADRQPEFTQVDIEMSFVQGEDVMDMMEGVMSEVLAAAGVEHEFPLQRMQYADAMEYYGCDRPDVRFDMKLVNLTEIVRGCGFGVFAKAVEAGGVVKAINAKGAGDWSRGDIDKLANIAAANGAKGMAWIAYTTDGAEKSPIIKFFDDETYAKMKEALNVEPGDLVLFAADTADVANAVLSALRLHMAEALNIPREGHALLWVVNFPMFRYDEEEKKYAAEHHPFTMVPPEEQHKIEEAPLECGSYPYPHRRAAASHSSCVRPDRRADRRKVRPPHPRPRTGRSSARRHRARPRPTGHATCGQAVYSRCHRVPEDLFRVRPHDGRSERGYEPPAQGSSAAYALKAMLRVSWLAGPKDGNGRIAKVSLDTFKDADSGRRPFLCRRN